MPGTCRYPLTRRYCFYAGYLQVSAHTAVFINEPRLLEFKLLLLKEGIQAEFSAGVLICNNCVAIKRVSDAIMAASWHHVLTAETCC